MKKASQIILLIAGIVAILGALAWLVLSIVYFLIGGFFVAINNGTIPAADVPQWVWDFIDSFMKNHDGMTMDVVIATMFATGAIYLVFALFSIPAAILAFMARGKEKQGLYIACIVFGVLSATAVATVGGIFGLIALGTEKQEPKPEVASPVEEKPAEEVPAEEPKAE